MTQNNKFIASELDFSLKTFGIIHVGNGEKRSPGEFTTKLVKQSNTSALKIYVPDIENIAKAMKTEQQLKQFYDLLKNSYSQRNIPQQLQELMIRYSSYSMSVLSHVNKVNTEYLEHVKVSNKIYIPGSTIKGAILTALYNHVLDRLAFDFYEIDSFVIKLINNTHIKKKDLYLKELDRLVFLWLKFGEKAVDYFSIRHDKNNKDYATYSYSKFNRWLRITDTNLIPIKNNLYLFSLTRFPSNIPNFAECIPFGKKFNLKIAAQQDLRFDLKDLLKIVNDHYWQVFKREEEWFTEKRNKLSFNKKYSLILDNVKMFYNKGPTKDEILLRIGFGSGLYSVSLLPFVEKYAKEKNMPYLVKNYVKNWKLTRGNTTEEKTKWLVNVKVRGKPVPSYYSLGWVSLSLK